MNDDRQATVADTDKDTNGGTPPGRTLSPAARRALAEAEERRRLAAQQNAAPAKEFGGRIGPDPIRYGDWEKGGIVSDF